MPVENIEELIEKILNYEGNSFYINTIQRSLKSGGGLTSSQIAILSQSFLNESIKTENKDLVKRKLKEFKIDWSKYNSRKPYEFQKQAIQWLLNTDRAILAYCMGLGKSTVSVIASLESKDVKKVLVVCPASLKYNWKKEIEFYNNDITIISKEWSNNTKFVIINYDLLKKYQPYIVKGKFDLIISDESHAVKNLSSQRTKMFHKIANKIPKVWLLTGTPIANKPIDLYSLLKICKHPLGKNKQYFGERYCNGKLTHFGWDFSGASNLKELYYQTQDVLSRKKKEEVLELPSKHKIPIYLELKNKTKYKKCVEEYYKDHKQKLLEQIYKDLDLKFDPKKNSSDSSYTNKLAQLAIMRQFTAIEKIEDGSMFEIINNLLEEDRKIIIFTNYLKVIDLYKEKYKDTCLTLDGRLSLEERQKSVDKFQEDDSVKLIVCNLAVAATGITLTAANTCIYNDLNFSPAVMSQSEDRPYRIGQKRDVEILYPVYNDTIDSTILEVIENKIKNINQAIDGKETITIFSNSDVINEIYSKLKI